MTPFGAPSLRRWLGVEVAHSENYNLSVGAEFSIFHGSVVKRHAARRSMTSAGKSLPIHISGASNVYGVANWGSQNQF
jgi:hypothetical protein